MSNMRDFFLILIIGLLMGTIAGCSGSDTPANPAIQNFMAVPSIVSPGQTSTLTMSFTGGNGSLAFGNSTTAFTFGNATTIKPRTSLLCTLTVANRAGVKVSATTSITMSPIQGRFTSSIGTTLSSRDNYTATLLPSGKVLLAGGGLVPGNGGVVVPPNLAYHKSAELIDPGNPVLNTAPSVLTGFMNYSSALHSATYLDPAKVTGPNSGMVLFLGGWDGTRAHSEAQVYNPATGLFTVIGNMAGGVRAAQTATLLNDGTVLITGGYDGSLFPLATAELFNPATGTFTTVGPMSVGRYGHTATLLGNGMVLIAGGTPYDARCELYNPATRTFHFTKAGMTYTRSFHTATLLSGAASAKVLIAGGSTGVICELYDPLTDTFALTGPMTAVRAFHTATLLSDTRVLVTGGSDNTAEFYDPNTRTFTATLRNMKEARSSHAAILLPNGLVFIAGGTGARNRTETFK